jgi:hypothetical protein
VRTSEDGSRMPAIAAAPRPGDFSIGTIESRVAARRLAEAHAAQNAEAPTIYRALGVERNPKTMEIYDYETGLPVSSESKADKPLSPKATQPSLDTEEIVIIIES